ncbi:hypothetical protein REPUB_Repub10bG0186000 [Reevesia pubescens]
MLRLKKKRSLIYYSHPVIASNNIDGGGDVAAAINLLCCQADERGANLKDAKQYHRCHKVCEPYAIFGLVNGIRQRFCQQCS